ncbi:porin [Pararhizobium sp.]|uniref:porin n=1 Tax=Pararhizobium sp. TaxID=1977563 RepID=UPI003BA9ED68
MNIKSLLLGSAAALAAVSGAQAADAIVAAEPEPLEYVRVCDAFGTGYFYIPGTETCLKISGYVRTQLEYKENGFSDDSTDLNAFTRGQLVFEAKNDTEYGALSSAIVINAEQDDGVYLDAAWISIAGFDVGNYYTWWDADLNGEADVLSSNDTSLNGIRYTYDGGTFQVGVAVEELEGATGLFGTGDNGNDDIGAGGLIGFSLGGVKATVIGSYDFNAEEAAFRAIVTADIGPGTLGIAGIYATDANYYWDVSEWSAYAEYKIQATDKLFITPSAQYFGDVDFVNVDAWRVGLTAGYQITEGLRSLATVSYTDADEAGNGLTGASDSQWRGFVRLQRDF